MSCKLCMLLSVHELQAMQDHHEIAHLASKEVQQRAIQQTSIIVDRCRVCDRRRACIAKALQRRSRCRRAGASCRSRSGHGKAQSWCCNKRQQDQHKHRLTNHFEFLQSCKKAAPLKHRVLSNGKNLWFRFRSHSRGLPEQTQLTDQRSRWIGFADSAKVTQAEQRTCAKSELKRPQLVNEGCLEGALCCM
jgi:hypothetical protein